MTAAGMDAARAAFRAGYDEGVISAGGNTAEHDESAEAWADYVAAIPAPTTATPADDVERCKCFGGTGFQASTYHDADDVERCDFCGLPPVAALSALRPAPQVTVTVSAEMATEMVAFAPLVACGPCTHRWAYAPTVGYISCIDCRETHLHDDPVTIAYLAALIRPGSAQ